MAEKRYYLKKNTLLDERYEIGEVLGEGGFGITYAGVNKRIGLKVAIKEYYSAELMDRDTSVSDQISLVDPQFAERFRTEKDRFLKEARILSDFSGESGIVHVIDYFEANDTVYIVMEFISGITLRQYVKQNGVLSPDVLFRRVKPLLSTLGRIHSAGLVHRDISPENIMVLEDGSFCLIDFGAATRFADGAKTFSTVYKTGYAAPEQYRNTAKITPSSDLYALSASSYYCLTGTEPEDSLQRILVDELVPAEELCDSLSKAGADILAKGLKLRQDERWQSAEEMLKAIEEVWPDQEEQTKKPRKKLIAACVIGTVLLLLIAGGLIYYFTHRIELKFRGIETETVWLTPNEGTSFSDFNAAVAVIKDRLEVFAGKNNYLWNETDEGIRFKVPASVFCNQNPGDACRAYITRRMSMYITDPSALEEDMPEKELEEHSVYIDRSGISEVSKEENRESFLKITLTEEASAEVDQAFPGLLKDQDRAFCMYFDLDDKTVVHFSHDCSSLGDGRTFVTGNNLQEGNYLETLNYDLTHEEGITTFGVTAPDLIEWEDPDVSMVPGKYQTNADSIAGDYMIFKYPFSSVTKEQRSDWFHNMIAFKERLDALEKPYAFGLTEYDDNAFYIRMAKDALSQEEIGILGNHDCTMYLGTKWSYSEIGSLSEKPVSVNDEGNGLSLSYELESYTQTSLPKNLAEVEKELDPDEYYLFVNGGDTIYPIAKIRPDELRQMISNGKIVFTDLLFDDRAFAEFMVVCNTELLAKYNYNYDNTYPVIMYYSGSEDEKPERLKTDEFPRLLEPLYTRENTGADQMEAYVLEAGGEWNNERISTYSGLSAEADVLNIEKEQLAETGISFIENFYETFRENFELENVSVVWFVFLTGDLDDPDAEGFSMTIGKTSAGHQMSVHGRFYFQDPEDAAIKEIKDRLAGSDILDELFLKDESGYNIWN